jgi:hypothetical protein
MVYPAGDGETEETDSGASCVFEVIGKVELGVSSVLTLGCTKHCPNLQVISVLN